MYIPELQVDQVSFHNLNRRSLHCWTKRLPRGYQVSPSDVLSWTPDGNTSIHNIIRICTYWQLWTRKCSSVQYQCHRDHHQLGQSHATDDLLPRRIIYGIIETCPLSRNMQTQNTIITRRRTRDAHVGRQHEKQDVNCTKTYFCSKELFTKAELIYSVFMSFDATTS